MINTLDDFVRVYSEIQRRGWIRTHRAGPTGIGKTLEDLLGIPENNIDGPDFGEYELKSCRINSNSMLTMFTCSPLPRGSNTLLRLKYGYSSDAYDNDEKVLHATLSGDHFSPIANTGHQLKFTCTDDAIFIESEEGIENIYWTKTDLKRQFENKYKNKFVYAKANSRGFGADEEFLFLDAWEVSGFNYYSFIDMLESGKIYVDLRIGQYPDGRTHDHGTAFRIREYDQPLLFTINNRIG